MVPPAQTDYKRYPKYMRGSPTEVAQWEQKTREGYYALEGDELFWRDLQPFLLQRGYRLRPRFAPDWVPSWLGTNIHPTHMEDYGAVPLPNIMDARREDDSMVAIKWIPNQLHTQHELDILRFLASDELRSDPRNHTYPLLDVFYHPTLPTGVFVVSPWLGDLIQYRLRYVNDVADMMLQSFEGLSFLHAQGIAHRDCTNTNIMLDYGSLFAPGVRPHPHLSGLTEDMLDLPSPRRRCRGSARYYFIDFGLSARFDPAAVGLRLVLGGHGRDQTVPELSDTVPYDPFKLDVYVLGNYFLTEYISNYTNLEFLRPVLNAMTRRDPNERPTIDDALKQLVEATRRRNGLAFRWRLRPVKEGRVSRVFWDLMSVFEELYTWIRVPFCGFRELSFGRPHRVLAPSSL
ncbi:hypothetical protein EXIGLDRAFT_831503 [Exidia glandulosa HHB12029]|uniref:Protein kinase domain-containing protein n=1 Tax=Exidia glandulosa HHB12029 TaxID=1314781 RepID=A0A165MJQ4_EXIGL|nr:hypothetical protein EXIGLDRAFT_831503 [Exidia glandulosa HHB12029]